MLLAASAAGAIVTLAAPAQAGCGCDKPPPPPAQVRPRVTYPGTTVVLFDDAFRAGDRLRVTFRSLDGTSASVEGTVVARRDLADGVTKPQLPVTLPALPPGPASIGVETTSSATPVMAIRDDAFTVAAMPVVVPDDYGKWSFPNQTAAVDRDGVVYLTLDLSGLTQPLVLDARGVGLPLRFEAADVLFFNVQGFAMQQLVQAGSGDPIPGMSVTPSTTATASDTLHYSRHEFRTYFLDHAERLPHAVDPSDPNWHRDGTRHVDHDHLILAIAGNRPDGTLLAPGQTPPFRLELATYSLFRRGLAAVSSVALDGGASTSSFAPLLAGDGHQGTVFTNGLVTLRGGARVDGDVTGSLIVRDRGTTVTGKQWKLASPETFMSVGIPRGLTDLGALTVGGGATQTIRGPGSFRVAAIDVSNAGRLFVDNTLGPVTLYVTGAVSISGGGTIAVADPDPEMFAVYVSGKGPVTLSNAGRFYGVVYAPTSPITLTGGGSFTGAFVGDTLSVSNGASVQYDETLAGW